MPKTLFIAVCIATFSLPVSHAWSGETATWNAGSGWAQCPAQNRKSVRPGCVHDGDTFWFGGIKYRFACVDAAELSTSNGPKARDLLIATLNKPGTTITDIGVQDHYKRHLAIVSGVDVEMLADGLAVDPDYRDARYFCRKK